MHAAVGAQAIVDARGAKPGLSELRALCNPGYGFFVKYRRRGKVRRTLERWEAVIELLVQDLCSQVAYSRRVIFLVDTGSDVTIIPRTLLPAKAFPPDKAQAWVPICGLTGRTITGWLFAEALLSMIPPSSSAPGLSFKVPVLVADQWYGDHAVLGLDVLRRLIVVSDQEHLCFWSQAASECPNVVRDKPILLS